jgi:nicotinamidase-related amidase
LKTALVILDMLNDFVDGTLANRAAAPIIDPIASLAAKARGDSDWLVVYANDAHQPGDLEFKVFGEHAVAGSSGAAVVPGLAPQEGDIIVPKRFYSAFTQTDLAATLRVHGVERVVLAGQHTNCCCRHTAYDAYLLGMEVIAASDATCVFEPLYPTRYAEAQQDALDYLATFYRAGVLSSGDLL